MRKRHQYRMLLMAFAFALVGAAFFSGYAGMRSQIVTHAPASNDAHDQEDWKKFTDEIIAYATLALALANFIMAGAVVRQAKLARDEFNATHRPKIILREAFIAPLPQDGQPIQVAYSLANVGVGPAIIIESLIDICVRSNIDDVFHRVMPSDSQNMIGREKLVAGSHLLKGFANTGVVWDTRAKMDYVPAHLGIFFSGMVVYSDAAGTRRRTAFHCRYYHDRQRFYPSDDPQLNYAD